MPRAGGLPALLALLAVCAAAAVVVLTAQSRGPDAAAELAAGPGGKAALIAHLRSLLAEKRAARAQAPVDSVRTELTAAAAGWKSARSDWKPYDPSLSLMQNKLQRQADADARETELDEQSIVRKLATQGQAPEPHKQHVRARLERYQSNVYGRHPKKACTDWGAHPIDCIRAAYNNHLKGTKFSPLRRRYDGRVTETSLDRERNLISKKVSEGLIKGSIKPPKHDQAVTGWLHRVKEQMRAARKRAMRRALAAKIKREERHSDEKKIAKEWASGVAASGPEAGRRYYINYATGKTQFSAPKYVKRALRDVRLRKKAEAQRAVQHEAKLYEEGFRAAQHAILLEGGRTTSLSEVPKPETSLVGERRLQQIHAEKAINNFLQKGGRHPKPRAYTWKDLAKERARIARELGYKSLTHEEGRLPHVQRQSQALHSQQKVIVDAWGRPLTHEPTTEDYPAGSGEYESPAASKPAESKDTEEAVAKAVAQVASAVKQKTDALQTEVSAQQAIIDDLEHKVAERTRATEREGAAASAPLARGRAEQAKPALGSMEMAKFANNLGTGTNVVDMYDDLKEKADYAGVANRGGQLRSPKDFAAVRDAVQRQVRGDVLERAEAQKVARDMARVASEAKQVGGRDVAGAALAAVHKAMASETEDAKIRAAAASGSLPPPLDEGAEAAKYKLPSSHLLTGAHLVRRLAADAAPVGKAKLAAIAARTLNRMQQSSDHGAEMI